MSVELDPVIELNSKYKELNSKIPIPFVPHLNVHEIEDRWMWIGIEKGVLVVLNKNENEIFKHLISGLSPQNTFIEKLGDFSQSTQIAEKIWLEIVELVNKVAQHGFIQDIPGRWEEKLIRPEKFARFHLTQRCQLRCVHCYASSGPEISASGELSTEHWVSLIRQITQVPDVSLLFTGGEPLLREDCTHLLHVAKSAGANVSLFSNGLLVPRYIASLADSINFLQISLGAPEEKVNDEIRGNGTYNKIIQAIDVAAEAQVSTRVGITAMVRNWQSLKRSFCDFARRYRGTCITFHIGHGVCNYGRGRNLDPEWDIAVVRKEITEMLFEVNGPPDERIVRRTTGCGYAEQLVIASDGQVYPCHLLHGSLGHVDTLPILQWYQRLREVARCNVVSRLEPCSICDIRSLCGGTCRVINEQKNGDRFISTCTTSDYEEKLLSLKRLYCQ